MVSIVAPLKFEICTRCNFQCFSCSSTNDSWCSGSIASERERERHTHTHRPSPRLLLSLSTTMRQGHQGPLCLLLLGLVFGAVICGVVQGSLLDEEDDECVCVGGRLLGFVLFAHMPLSLTHIHTHTCTASSICLCCPRSHVCIHHVWCLCVSDCSPRLFVCLCMRGSRECASLCFRLFVCMYVCDVCVMYVVMFVVVYVCCDVCMHSYVCVHV
mgnify:CR=1 FL=1